MSLDYSYVYGVYGSLKSTTPDLFSLAMMIMMGFCVGLNDTTKELSSKIPVLIGSLAQQSESGWKQPPQLKLSR